MNLTATYAALKAALERLGIEVGPEVLALWRDRRRHGRDPLPAIAVRELAAWATSQLPEPPSDGEAGPGAPDHAAVTIDNNLTKHQ